MGSLLALLLGSQQKPDDACGEMSSARGPVVPKGTREEDNKKNIFRVLPEAGGAGEQLKGVNFTQQSWQGFITLNGMKNDFFFSLRFY